MAEAENSPTQLASTFESWYDQYRVKAKWPRNTTLVDLFNDAMKVDGIGEKIAIVDGGRTFTFAELDEKVNLVRDHLLAHGIKPEDPVGLSFERCAEYVIGYLGTLRAQAAYMPIEEAWPGTQLTNVLNDSTAKVVLTKARNLHRYADLKLDYEKPHIFCMDEGWEANAKPNPNEPLEWVINPRSRAYFVYTSGSTGKPKGIICPHEGSVMAYKQRIDLYPYNGEEREAVNIFFTWECIRPLIHGQTLYIIPDTHIYDPTKLVPWFHENKITRVMMTPSAFQNCIDIPELFEESSCETLKHLFFCGEVVTKTLLKAIETNIKHEVKVVNFYSVSETHDTTYGECKSELMDSEFSHAGYFVEDAHGVIVDEDLNVLPVDTPGELLIAGPSVCLEYLNLPDITAAKFFEWKYDGMKSKQRICRTGDRAKLTSDGKLVLLGRNSFMVKIRGYTVSLEATESKMKKLDEFRSVLVTAQGSDISHNKMLVAYVVLKDKEAVLTRKDIEAKLLDVMPFYSVPTHMIILDKLPLNNLGKVQRKSKNLPSYKDVPVEQRITNYPLIKDEVLTEGMIEVRDLWSTMLELEYISLQDDFTRIGGNSLSIVKMLRLVHDKFGVNIGAAEFYNGHSTLQGLCDLIFGTDAEKKVDFSYPLSEEIVPKAAYPEGSTVTNVFITGTTGFVGAYLLAKFMGAYPDATFHCLVRAKPNVECQERVIQNMTRYSLWDDSFSNRCKAIEGNLGSKNFGLSGEEFEKVGSCCELIIHCGKEVNLMKSMENLKGSNVIGTETVLRMACAGEKVSRVAYISTLGVFPLGVDGFDESSTIGPAETLANGYSQTSVMSENLVQEAIQRGIPVLTFRLGQMTPSLTDPQWNPVDFWFHFFNAGKELKLYPDLLELSLEFTPVDYASDSIFHLVSSDGVWKSENTIFHIVNPNEILYKDLLNWVEGEKLSWDDWKAKIAESTDVNEHIGRVHAMVDKEKLESWEYYTYQTFGCGYTQKSLKQYNFERAPPVISQQIIQSWLSSL